MGLIVTLIPFLQTGRPDGANRYSFHFYKQVAPMGLIVTPIPFLQTGRPDGANFNSNRLI